MPTTTRERPPKPYPDFPLFTHANGQWAKKIDNRRIYFGAWADWQTALRKYHALDGSPQSLKAAIDRYVTSRRLLQGAGEISHRHLHDIEKTLAGLLGVIGSKPLGGSTSEDYGRDGKTGHH